MDTKLFPLTGTLQHYAWGGNTFIPHLLGITPQEGKQYAEYWLGSHPSSPSIITVQNTHQLLNSFLEEQHLPNLPYLFKVLDVKNILSIQVHPSKAQAEEGFNKENSLGIPLSDIRRNYKDNNHKPEIGVSLGDVWLLHGFLQPEKLQHNLQENIELQPFLQKFNTNNYQELYTYVMTVSQTTVDAILTPLIERIASTNHPKTSPHYWALKAYQQMNNMYDRGIFSVYFFNIVNLKEGEGIFQAAGVPHAYMEGQLVELMANSDNVLRGGLTPKHIDIPELLNIISFEETKVNIIRGDNVGGTTLYPTPVTNFLLSKIELKNSSKSFTATSTEILCILEGEGEIVEEGGNSIPLTHGASYIALTGCNYTITGNLTVYKAQVNV